MTQGERKPPPSEDVVEPLSDEILENVVGGAGTITPQQLDLLLKGEGSNIPPVPWP